MLSEKELKQDIDLLNGLQGLVEVYGEVASVRMRKIRSFVLQNRDFLNAINDIFNDALAGYAQKTAKLVQRGKIKKGQRVTFLAHNGKTVAVFLSANTGFYGDVVQETFEKFLEETKDQNVEITIVGRLGLSLFREAMPDTPYTFFELPDFGVNEEKMAEVIRHLVQYEEIRVYYGKYHSVVTQKPTEFSVNAGTIVREDVAKPEVSYLYEPSVEEVLMFFETQIFASLFDQSIRESQLAKFASRILAMDRAGENIRQGLREAGLRRLRFVHRTTNRKQLNALTSTVARRT